MVLTLKPEYAGSVLEIIRYETLNIAFDTNTVDSSEYEYYYNVGFNWAFDAI
jgi:hypothetical protein